MTILALINPIDPGTGSRVSVRLCASQDSAATGAGGEVWWPAIVREPSLDIALFDGDFTSAVQPGAAQIDVRLDVLARSGVFPRVLRYDWAGAKATLYRLVAGSPVFLAEMKVSRFASEDYQIGLSLAIDDEWAQAEVLFNTYAGTTGLEGGADLKGRVKPWVFGRAKNVEPVFLDQIDNVFQVSGYGAVSAITAVYERGASFGASQGDFADLTALLAATLQGGQWATCLAQGLFRLGAPPAGVITCDVDGDSTVGFIRRTGAILKEIARRLGLTSKVNSTSLDALDAAVPYNVNIVISDQTTLLELAQRMVAPCNAVAGLDFDGRLIAPRVAFGSPALVLDAQGRQMPPVLGMAKQNSSPPYKRIQFGADRSWRVHSFDEVSFQAELIERGVYDALKVYREGNIVTTADNARWVYINATAAAGNAPPTWPTTSNAFWDNLTPPIDGSGGGGDGLNVATVAFFKRSASAPISTDKPTDSIVFTFATGACSPAISNGWTSTPPATNGNPLYVRYAPASSITATDTILTGEWGDPIKLTEDGAPGVNGLSGFLTNEAHNVAVDAAGTFTLTGSEGAFKVFSGATDVTADCTFSIVGGTVSGLYQIRTVNGLRLWIDTGGAAAGEFFLTIPGAGWTSTAETFTLRATYGSVTIDRVYSISKAVAGANGVSAISGLLTNEAHTVSAAADGSGYSLTNAGGTFRVFNGTTDVTTTSTTYSIVAPATKNGLTIAINATTGVYSLSGAAWTTDAEFFTVRAVHGGVTIDRIYTITKARAGAGGANAKTLTILSDRQTIAYDAAGAPTPTTQTTTFAANKQNTTGTVTWSITDAAGVARTPVTSFLSSATGDTVTMTEAQFASARNGTSGVIVTGTITDGTTFSDKISVVRVQEGQTGATGDTAGVISLYIRSAEGSTPAKPTSTSMVYTVATNTITNAGSWSTAIPAANGLPLWRIDRPFTTNAATITVTGASFGTQTIVNRDGVSATTGLLTNEVHTVAAAADGTGYSLVGAGGNFEVFFGGANVRLTSTFSIVGGTDGGANWTQTKNGLTMTISELSGVYTLSGASWTSDTETFTLRSVYQGVTLDQVYTITKAKAGAGGAAAKLVTLSANRQQVRFNSADALDPSTQDIVFTATRQGTAVGVVWSIFDLAGTSKTPLSSFISPTTGDAVTMTAAQFNSARGSTNGVRVRATVTDGSAFFDEITVIRVADGIDSNQVRISTNFETFPFIAHTGQPVTQTASLNANLTAISGTVTWRLKAEGSETLITPTSAWATVSGNNLTITQTQFAQFLTDYPGTTMRVVATLGGFSDERVLTRVADATTNPAGGSFIRTRNGDVSVGGWIGAAVSTTIPAAVTRAGARSLQLATNSRERPRIATVIRQGDSFRLRYRIRTIGSGTACGNIFFALYTDAGSPLTNSTAFTNLPIHAPNTLDWTYVDQVITYNGTTEILDWCPGWDSINATLGNFLIIDFDMDFAPVNPVAAGNANLVRFSRMEGGQGWSTPFSTIPITTATRPAPFAGRVYIRTDGAPTASGQQMYVGINSANHFVVNAGERFSISSAIEAVALTGSAPSLWQLYVDFFNAAGTNIGSATIASGSGNRTATDRLAGFATAPANAVKAALMLRVDSGSAGTLYASFEGPMVTRAAIGQTDHPAFTPGPNSDDGADVTATAQRSIEPQFPVIEIKQGEAGHTGNRTVTHAAKRGTSTITGGTWSLPVVNLGAGSATINSTTGTVTLSGIVQSGAYAVRYTHTDGIATDQAVNVTYVPTAAGGVNSAKTARATSSAGTANNNLWQDILILTMNDCPAGRVNFGAFGFNSLSRLDPLTGTGTADFEAQLTLDGVTLTSVPSQNVVSGGVMAFSEFGALFQETHPITAGNRTFRIQMRRTSGTGTILTTSTVLEPTIIAT